MVQFSLPNTKYTSGRETSAIMIAAKFVPRESARRSCFWVAFSLVLTRKVPKIEQITPHADKSIGRAIASRV